MGKKYGMGWRPQPKDERDNIFCVDSSIGDDLGNNHKSLRKWVHSVYDQGGSSSCVAQFFKAGVQIREAIKGLPYDPISAYYLYAMARLAEGRRLRDGGSYPRLAAQAMRKFGAPSLSVWPDVRKNLNRHPSITAAMSGMQRRLGRYEYISAGRDMTGDLVKRAIQKGLPVGAGLRIGSDWFGAKAGQVLEPTNDPVGGHMITIVGYGDDTYEILNSWGDDWCDGGFGLVSKKFVEEDASDIIVFDGWNRIAQ